MSYKLKPAIAGIVGKTITGVLILRHEATDFTSLLQFYIDGSYSETYGRAGDGMNTSRGVSPGTFDEMRKNIPDGRQIILEFRLSDELVDEIRAALPPRLGERAAFELEALSGARTHEKPVH